MILVSASCVCAALLSPALSPSLSSALRYFECSTSVCFSFSFSSAPFFLVRVVRLSVGLCLYASQACKYACMCGEGGKREGCDMYVCAVENTPCRTLLFFHLVFFAPLRTSRIWRGKRESGESTTTPRIALSGVSRGWGRGLCGSPSPQRSPLLDSLCAVCLCVFLHKAKGDNTGTGMQTGKRNSDTVPLVLPCFSFFLFLSVFRCACASVYDSHASLCVRPVGRCFDPSWCVAFCCSPY